MMRFDHTYWGIYLTRLDKVEETCRRIGKDYGLEDEQFQSIEDEAKELANERMKTWKDPIKHLTAIIAFSKVDALINAICEGHDLDPNDFDYEPNGLGLQITYKGEEI